MQLIGIFLTECARSCALALFENCVMAAFSKPVCSRCFFWVGLSMSFSMIQDITTTLVPAKHPFHAVHLSYSHTSLFLHNVASVHVGSRQSFGHFFVTYLLQPSFLKGLQEMNR